MLFPSKLPQTGTTIFTVMSRLAQEYQAINLSQGFPNFDPPQELRDLVYHHMQAGKNQYAPMPGVVKLREMLAQKHGTSAGISIDPQTEITITAGATQAIFTVIQTVVHAGDEVILIDPCFDCYEPAITLAGGKAVRYRMKAPDYAMDWEAFGQLINPRTRLIIVNTPHNPTGTIWQKRDWQRLAQLVEGTSTLVLSDEVYEHLIFDGYTHDSMLAIPALRERGFVVYSFGKTFNSTGWKVGYCIAPPAITAEFRKAHQFIVFAVHSPTQYALADFLEDPANYQSLGQFYQQKRDFFLETIKGSSLRPIPSYGTYFQLVDYSAIKDVDDITFCQWLTKEVGVAAIPVSVFSEQELPERVVRLCFAKTEDVLAAAGERLVKL